MTDLGAIGSFDKFVKIANVADQISNTLGNAARLSAKWDKHHG